MGAFASAVVRDAGGEIIQMIGILEDITAAKEAEQKLAQARKMEAVGQLAGGIAHKTTTTS